MAAAAAGRRQLFRFPAGGPGPTRRRHRPDADRLAAASAASDAGPPRLRAQRLRRTRLPPARPRTRTHAARRRGIRPARRALLRAACDRESAAVVSGTRLERHGGNGQGTAGYLIATDMTTFRPFEIEALRLLCESALPTEVLTAI